MPSEFLNPYSVLELAAYRYLSRFSTLIEAYKATDPAQRMLGVMKWFFACLAEAKMYKKPYNPVVGETHHCHITADEVGTTYYVGEQVSHHPPVSAMHLHNPQEDISVTGNISFGVKFWLNSATIATSGYLRVLFGKRDEEYNFSKALPDLQMKNVVFGTRKMKWDASSRNMEVVCNKTNTKATFHFDQSGSSEMVVGEIEVDGELVYTFHGDIDGIIHYRSALVDESDEDDDGIVLHNAKEAVNKTVPLVYPPQPDEYPSMVVWRTVSQHIIANNMTEADKAKHLVEEDQRRRVRLGEDDKKEHKYFRYREDVGQWVYKEKKTPTPP